MHCCLGIGTNIHLMKRIHSWYYGSICLDFLCLQDKSNILSLTVLKRQDVITSIVKVPHLNFTVTSSQKGILTIFDNQVILTQINSFIIPLGNIYGNQVNCDLVCKLSHQKVDRYLFFKLRLTLYKFLSTIGNIHCYFQLQTYWTLPRNWQKVEIRDG